MQGRIEGRKSDDGKAYELRQGGTLLRSIPIDDAKDDKKLAAAIRQNGWGPTVGNPLKPQGAVG